MTEDIPLEEDPSWYNLVLHSLKECPVCHQSDFHYTVDYGNFHLSEYPRQINKKPILVPIHLNTCNNCYYIMQFSCDDYPHSVRGNILLYKDDLEEFVNSLKCNNVKGISIAANNIKYNCEGKKCDWDNWEADHIVAWSKGGKTIVENGQVACPECNSSKNNT